MSLKDIKTFIDLNFSETNRYSYNRSIEHFLRKQVLDYRDLREILLYYTKKLLGTGCSIDSMVDSFVIGSLSFTQQQDLLENLKELEVPKRQLHRFLRQIPARWEAPEYRTWALEQGLRPSIEHMIELVKDSNNIKYIDYFLKYKTFHTAGNHRLIKEAYVQKQYKIIRYLVEIKKVSLHVDVHRASGNWVGPLLVENRDKKWITYLVKHGMNVDAYKGEMFKKAWSLQYFEMFKFLLKFVEKIDLTTSIVNDIIKSQDLSFIDVCLSKYQYEERYTWRQRNNEPHLHYSTERLIMRSTVAVYHIAEKYYPLTFAIRPNNYLMCRIKDPDLKKYINHTYPEEFQNER